MHKRKTGLVVVVCVLGLGLMSWAQIAQTNQAVMNSHEIATTDRGSGQIDERLVPPSASRLTNVKGSIVIKEFKHDTGPLLREVAPLLPEFSPSAQREIENNVNPHHRWRNQVREDRVRQKDEISPRSQTPDFAVEFDGIGFGDSFFCNCMPPDNDGAVGTTQYVQFTNLAYQVFDKNGTSVLGPLSGNTFWSGFGGACQADNSGDPVIRFDAAAQRWLVAQFALNNAAPDYECVAVSTSADATGSYNRYAFPFNDFPDYPKIGVWPDAYYFTFNNFNIAGTAFVGANVCAADRSKMLTGAAATIQCFRQNSDQFGMLPSDLDGATPPAAGTPNFVMELDPWGSANLDLFKFHVNFANPANSTFTGPILIPVAAFTPLCNTQYRGACVPQPTPRSDLLESLGDRLMWRLVYRNFTDHSTLLVSHSVVAGSSGGVRWYEIRNPETSPTVFQSGTFAPDSQYRWMPAIAMDGSQDIGVGFSRSGAASGEYPSLVYAGRVPSDVAGTLESEVLLKAGAGSQESGYGRWGDYSSLTVDPADDCTFWFTEEYEKTTGGFNWSTAIGSFKFPGCGGTFTLSASSGPLTISQGGGGTSTITVTPANGFAGTVALSVSGLPSGVTVSFTPSGIVGNGSSILALTVSSSTTAGTYSLTVSGTSGGLTQTAGLSLTVVVPSFTLTANASVETVVVGAPAALTLTSATVNGFNSAVNLSVNGLPRGVTAGFSPTSIAAPGGGHSTLTLIETTGATAGTYSLEVTAVGEGVTKNLPLSLTVVVPSLTLTSNISSASVVVGKPASFTLTSVSDNGFNSAVTLSVTGLPTPVRASFLPNPIAAPGNGHSTLTLTETTGAKAGTYNLTVTVAGGGVTKTLPLSLKVVIPSFTLMLGHASVSVKQGETMPITVTTSVVNGFSSAITLSVAGLPKGVTASLFRTRILVPGSGSSKLNLMVAAGTGSNVGTYSLSVTGTGGGMVETQKLIMMVTR